MCTYLSAQLLDKSRIHSVLFLTSFLLEFSRVRLQYDTSEESMFEKCATSKGGVGELAKLGKRSSNLGRLELSGAQV